MGQTNDTVTYLFCFLLCDTKLDYFCDEWKWQWFVVWESDAAFGVIYPRFIELGLECDDT